MLRRTTIQFFRNINYISVISWLKSHLKRFLQKLIGLGYSSTDLTSSFSKFAPLVQSMVKWSQKLSPIVMVFYQPVVY